MADKTHRNKTYGISLPVELKDRAEARATALGLTLSRYTSLCLEAELQGFAQILREDAFDLERVLARARDHLDAKSRSLDFESDVAQLLQQAGVPCERHPRVEHLRCDFLLRQPSTVREGHYRVVVECQANIRRSYAVALGQAILLRSVGEVDAVLLVVPYLQGFDDHIRDQFIQHHIRLTTPDTLLEAFEETVVDLQTQDLDARAPNRS